MGDRFEDGLALRRKVLGDAHVDRSLKARDEFTTDVQQIITEIGWGTIWNRPGLTLRERSMATVSFLVALGKAHELEHHLLGALRNGCTCTPPSIAASRRRRRASAPCARSAPNTRPTPGKAAERRLSSAAGRRVRAPAGDWRRSRRRR